MMEWGNFRLSQIGRIVTGKTPKTGISEYWNGEVPFVTPGDIQGTKHIDETARYVTEDGVASVKGVMLPAGAICVSCIGVLGYTAITTKKSISNQQINSVIVNDGFDADFVYYALCNSWQAFKNMEGFSSVVSILNKSTFSELEFQIPPIPIQRKIAAVLSALDDKIENNRRICKTLEEMVQAIFKSWFVDFEPWGGAMPATWNEKILGEVSENIRRRVGDEHREVLSAVAEGRLVRSDEYFNKQVFSSDISKYFQVDEGDFAYNPARINIGSIGVNDLDVKGCVSPFYVSVRVDPDYNIFFSQFFRTKTFNEEVKARANGSVRQVLNYPDFAQIRCVYPSKEDVKKFNAVCKRFNDLGKSLKGQTSALIEMRDALLPKLMSGEIDVEGVAV